MRLLAGDRLQVDGEAPAGHAQALHLRLHRRGQACGGGAAQLGQFVGLVAVVAGIGFQLLAQALDGAVVGVQRLQLLTQLFLQGAQLSRLDAVLARQTVDAVQALLDLLLALWVGLEVVDEAVETAHRLLDLDLCAGQQADGLVEGGRLAAASAQAVDAAAQGGEHVAAVAFAAQLEYLAAGVEQGAGVAQGLVLLFQFVQLAGAEGQVVQFLELVAEQLLAGALLVAVLRQALQLAAGLPPALGGQLHLAGQLAGAGIGVEQAAVGVGLEQ
ncbi:hypothetical protein D9M71_423420 [compost metagenome]